MIDSDLAQIYGFTTARLNEQVKRNSHRFPKDFMFRVSPPEWKDLISQSATSRWGGRRNSPFAFTEHGVTMLASVLRTARRLIYALACCTFAFIWAHLSFH